MHAHHAMRSMIVRYAYSTGATQRIVTYIVDIETRHRGHQAMTRPSHLFVCSCDGSLYDTRGASWSRRRPLRPTFQKHGQDIQSCEDLKASLRAGPYTSIGCYPLYFICGDGEAMSFDSVRKNLKECLLAIQEGDDRSEWRMWRVEINHEDAGLTCSHSGQRIPSAYGDDDDAS